MAEKKENIKTRLVLPFIAVVFILLLLAAYGSFRLQQYHIHTEIDTKVASVNQIFTSFLTEETKRMETQLYFLSQNEKLIEAWKEQSRYTLYAAAKPVYEKLNHDYGVTHFYFINPDKICFLRVHTPDRYGDSISRKTLDNAASSGDIASGIELGPLGTFTLRVVLPLIREDRLVGYLELGEEIEHLSPFLKSTLGLDFIFTINKENLDREKWEAGIKFLGKEESWGDFEDFVIINRTMKAVSPALKNFLSHSHETKTDGEDLALEGSSFRMAFLPLRDVSQQTVGQIVTIYETTEKKNALKHILANTFTIIFVILGGLFIFFYYYTDRLEEKLSAYQDRLEKSVEERTAELSAANENLLVELTERKKAQRRLKISQDEWRKSFNALTDIVTIQDRDMHIIKANKAAYGLLGKGSSEIVGKHCYEVFRGIDRPCDGCPVFDSFSDFRSHQEIIKHSSLGKIFSVSSAPVFTENGELEFIVHVAKDITVQKKMEEELLQSRKLEAIGTLAGGIAHDFNNILMAILGYVELAKEGIKNDPQVIADLDEAIKGAQRARDLVRQILAFSRKEDYEIEPLIPHLIVKESLKLLRASLPTSIEIRENIESDCGAILADPVKIQQILMNLCTNALHAMENEEGVLTVSLTCKDLTADDVAVEQDVEPGAFIELMVSDTGQGMDQMTLARIFEPFFTTKTVEKGTGMGLAVVHGIVRDFGGFIRVESSPGKGSTFRIYLPAIVKVSSVDIEEEKEQKTVLMGTGRILCVDDEEAIIKYQRSLLERRGYEVVGFTDSLKALECFQQSPDDWDLLITDQTMPLLTGENLVKEIIKIRPDLPIILCTGYSSQISEEKAKSLGIRAFVMKPLDIKNFDTLVWNVLSGSGNEQSGTENSPNI